MTLAVNVQQAPSQILDWITQVRQGEDVVFMQGGQPIAKIAIIQPTTKRRVGGGRGIVRAMAKDFDSPIDDFNEYQ